MPGEAAGMRGERSVFFFFFLYLFLCFIIIFFLSLPRAKEGVAGFPQRRP